MHKKLKRKSIVNAALIGFTLAALIFIAYQLSGCKSMSNDERDIAVGMAISAQVVLLATEEEPPTPEAVDALLGQALLWADTRFGRESEEYMGIEQAAGFAKLAFAMYTQGELDDWREVLRRFAEAWNRYLIGTLEQEQ